VKHSVLSTTPTAETPALSDEERLERRRRFIERVFSPDGLDRDTLEHIEQLTELDALRILRNDRAVADAAMSAIGELAQHSDGYHRVPLTDALIAAAAAEHGGIAVLHRDTHFNKLAEVLVFENVELPGS
jgi:predicted nucleic acid-binding protein